MIKKITVRTNSRLEFLDITREISKIVKDSGIKDGVCHIFIPHTTAAITINENADQSVVSDINLEINKIVPFIDNYKHLEGNSAAHIKATLFGSSEILFIEDGRLVLGTWQGIFFCEFDGPRTRNVFIKIIKG